MPVRFAIYFPTLYRTLHRSQPFKALHLILASPTNPGAILRNGRLSEMGDGDEAFGRDGAEEGKNAELGR